MWEGCCWGGGEEIEGEEWGVCRGREEVCGMEGWRGGEEEREGVRYEQEEERAK